MPLLTAAPWPTVKLLLQLFMGTCERLPLSGPDMLTLLCC